jgi:hypothetical protein
MIGLASISYLLEVALTRFSHRIYTAAADPVMAVALRSLGLLDVLRNLESVTPVIGYYICIPAKRLRDQRPINNLKRKRGRPTIERPHYLDRFHGGRRFGSDVVGNADDIGDLIENPQAEVFERLPFQPHRDGTARINAIPATNFYL